MPKNKGKGGKNRRRGKNENDRDKRELIFKEDGQEYAQVTKMLGGGYVMARCFDGVERHCHIRGKMKKKVWINNMDIILVGLRDYQQGKGDVIYKYTAEEARNLVLYGELPEGAQVSNVEKVDDEVEVVFESETGVPSVAPISSKADDFGISSSDESESEEEDDDNFTFTALEDYSSGNKKKKAGDLDIDGI